MAETEPLVAADAGDQYLIERSRALQRDSDADVWLNSLLNGDAGQATPAGAKSDTDIPLDNASATQKWLETVSGAPPDSGSGMGHFFRGVGQAVVGVAKDVGRGVIETPGAVVRGATSAVNEFSNTIGSLADWLYANEPEFLKGGILDPLAAMNKATGKDLKPSDMRTQMPEIFDPRQSVTGKTIEFTAQWLTSQALAGKVTKAFGMKASEWKRVVDAFAGGAFGFDPKQERLSNVIEEVAPNPLTEFLKADKDDPELLGRVKSGLEQAGLTAVADGVIQGVRALKGWAKGGATTAADDSPLVAKTASEAEAAPGGAATAAKPAVELSDDFAVKAADFLAGRGKDAPIQVNIERFAGTDTIKQTIADLSRQLPLAETVSMQTTVKAAREMGLTPEGLAGLEGKLFDRRQIMAGWMLFQGSAQKVAAAAAEASATGAPADIAKFNAAFQISHAILKTVKGESTEIARALQVHNAIRQAQPDMLKSLQSLIDEGGGTAVSMEMAARVSALAKDPSKAAEFIAKAQGATTRDQILYVWSNVLMSNPATQIVNVGDTSVSTLLQVPTTWFASQIGHDVARGEATARLYGQVQGFKDGLRLAWRAWQTGERQLPGVGTNVDITERGMASAASDLSAGGAPRRAGDYLKMLIPTRISMAGDQLTGMMNYRGELNALAWREAMAKGLDPDETARIAAQLADNPTPALDAAAQARAVIGTFNEPLQGKVGPAFANLVDGITIKDIPVGRFLFATFVRTPINIERWVVHHTPAGFLSPKIQADIAAGGATRDQALARIAVGSGIMASFADLTMSGRITGVGPKDPAVRRNLEMRPGGWQPYSVNVNGKWYSYNRSGTVGSLVGIAADATELVSGIYFKERDQINFDGAPVEDSIAAAVTLPFANAVLSKVYMQQLAQFVDALAEPHRYGESYFQKLAGSMVPAGVGAIERTVDPEIRRAQDWMQAVEARIPGLSNDLAPKLDRWGEKRVDENGIWNLFAPTRVASPRGSAIDGEIDRLKMGVDAPRQVQDFGQQSIPLPVKLSPEQHNRLIELAGKDIKDPQTGKGARETLDDLVGTAKYRNAPDGAKELMIRQVLFEYRQAAKKELLRTDDDLRRLVDRTIKERSAKFVGPPQ